jgi:hypothetical protein
MLRKLAIMAVAVVIPLGSFLALDSSVALAAPPNATGIANCPIYSGKGTLSPGLTPAGAAGGVKINFSATLTSPAGGPCGNSSVTTPAGVKIVGGKVTGSGSYQALASPASASSCSDFDGTDVVGTITVTIKWKTTPPAAIAKTTITYTNNPATVSGSPTDTITLLAPPGSATKAGSFTAPASNNTTTLKTNLPAPPCGPGPFSHFKITGGNVLV